MSSIFYAPQQTLVMMEFNLYKSTTCNHTSGLSGGPVWCIGPVGAGGKRAFGDEHHCGGAP
jgi:hypothetical protein